MSNHTTLGQLEEAHNDAVRAANARIEQAETFIHDYRSRMWRMQEDFYNLATREGLTKAPEFQHELRHVTNLIGENVYEAAQVVAGFEEDLTTMTKQHVEEREQLLHHQRKTTGDSQH